MSPSQWKATPAGVLPLLALLLGGAAPAARADDPELKFDKYRLQNGLTVILSEDHRLPQVAVNVWYHVGAANQSPGHSGFAHLFEHMMFSGSKHVQPSPFKVLEEIGAAGINGSTNFDRTNYYEVVPTSRLATALWLESDRMAFLLDTLDAKKLAVQRDVVSNERRQRYENSPYGPVGLRVCDLLFPAPHPYYECVIGSVPEIQAASIEDLKAFFQTWYGPQNASLALVGDFDPAVARRLVETWFGPIARGPEPVRPAVPEPVLPGVVRETLDDKVAELQRVELVYRGVRPFSDDEPAAEVLAAILGSGRSSRLYRSLVFDKQVAGEVDASSSSAALGGRFTVSAVAKAGHTAAELQPLLQAELDALRRDGPTQQEVERARRRFIAGRVRGLERLGSRADLLNAFQTYLGDPGYLPIDLARYRAVTPEAVKACAARLLVDDHRLELISLPVQRKAGGAP